MLQPPFQCRADGADPDQVNIRVAQGGRLRWQAPGTTADRSRLFSTTVGISLLLGCDLVLVRHWLPGLHLFVQADASLLREGPLDELVQEWERLEPGFLHWLAAPANEQQLVVTLPTAVGKCSLASELAPLYFDEVAFTIECGWPGRPLSLASRG